MFCMALSQWLVLRCWYRGGWGGFVYVVWALYRGHGSGIYTDWYWETQKNWNLMWTGWRQSKMFFSYYFFIFIHCLFTTLLNQCCLSCDKRLILGSYCCLIILTWKRTHQLFSLELLVPVPLPVLVFLSGLWPSSMKIFSPNQRMCQHQRPTTAWNSRGQFIEGDVAIGSLFFSACVLAELLFLTFFFFTSTFPLLAQYFCRCLAEPVTSN